MTQDRPSVRRHSGETELPPDVQAAQQLHYIRGVMERSGSFTAVPGSGMIVIGLTAVGAAYVASLQATPAGWLAVWLGEACIALAIAGITLYRKARAVGVSLFSGPARKYFLSLAPPLIAGAMLTYALWSADYASLLPATWLLLYGAGTITAGMSSVRTIPVMGACFMLLAGIGLIRPELSDWLLALGFGGLHIVFGWIITQNHGG